MPVGLARGAKLESSYYPTLILLVEAVQGDTVPRAFSAGSLLSVESYPTTRPGPQLW